MIIGFPLTIDSRSYLSKIGNRFELDYYGKPFLYNHIYFILKVRNSMLLYQNSKFCQLTGDINFV